MKSRSVGYVFLDSSALVSKFLQEIGVIEDGVEHLKTFLDKECGFYTVPFCFYETLNVLKIHYIKKKFL